MAVTNPYYEFTPEFIPGTKARSDEVNLQYQAIQNAFDFLPGTSDALTTGTATFAPESGAGNAYVVTMPDTRTTEQDGDEVVFFATHTNTGAATLEVDGLGAKSIVRADGLALTANDIQNGLLYVMRYDASNTRYQLVGPSTSYLTDITASEAAAAASAAAALASENAAALSESNAATSEANAAISESLAQEWADKAIDSAITGNPGLYSARHWADGAAQAWAINPEDSAIGTTFGGDGATTYSAYHWAQKASATSGLPLPTTAGAMLRVNDAINAFEENTNVISNPAGVGVSITKIAGAANYALSVDGGNVGTNEPVIFIKGNNGAGGIVFNNYAVSSGSMRFADHTSGQWVWGITNGGGVISSVLGNIGGIAGRSMFTWRGDNNAAGAFDSVVRVELETANQTILQDWLAGSPTKAEVARIDYDGTFVTVAAVTGSDANSAALLNEVAGSTNPTLVPNQSDLDTGIGWQAANNLSLVAGGFEMMRLDGTSSFQRVMAQYPLFIAESTPEDDLVGYGQFSVNAGTAQFTDASGNDFNFLSTLRLPTTAELRMQAAGSGIVYLYSTGSTDAEARYISLRHADGVSRGYMGHSSSLLELRNEIHGGAFRVNCENSSGVLTQMIDAQPDGIFDIRGATSVVITLGASAEFGANFALNGAASLYYDNQGRFYTMTSGSAQIRRATTTDTDQCRLGFANSNGVDRGWVGFGVQGNSRIELNSEVHGGAVYLTGETAGGSAQNLFSGTPGANDTIVYSNGVSELVVGTTKITANTLFLNERSAAIADVAGDGQLWVRNDSPNILMFTDDSGQDYAVAMNGGYVNDNVNVNNSWNFNTTGNRSANFVSYHGDGGNDTITLGNSTGTGLTNFPIYDSITIIAPGSGNITISEGTGTTLYDETGTDTVGGVVLSGGAVTIFRASATDYIIWGNGYT